MKTYIVQSNYSAPIKIEADSFVAERCDAIFYKNTGIGAIEAIAYFNGVTSVTEDKSPALDSGDSK
jgi:hypothetical protein